MASSQHPFSFSSSLASGRRGGRFPTPRFLLRRGGFTRAVLPASAFPSTGVLRLCGTPGDQRREVPRRLQVSVDLRPIRLAPRDLFTMRSLSWRGHRPSTSLWAAGSVGRRATGVHPGPRRMLVADHAAYGQVLDHDDRPGFRQFRGGGPVREVGSLAADVATQPSRPRRQPAPRARCAFPDAAPRRARGVDFTEKRDEPRVPFRSLKRYSGFMRSFEYRLYPRRAQGKARMACPLASRQVCKAMPEASMSRHDAAGKFLVKDDLCERCQRQAPARVPTMVLQCFAARLDEAPRRFLFTKERGERRALPGFQGGDRWHCIHLRGERQGSGRRGAGRDPRAR